MNRLAAQRRMWMLKKAKEQELKEALDERAESEYYKSLSEKIQSTDGGIRSEYSSVHEQSSRNRRTPRSS